MIKWEREGNVDGGMIKEALDFEASYAAYSTSDRERFASSKTLTHWNGLPYLGLLTSLVWAGKRGGYLDEETARKSEFTYSSGSLVDEFYDEAREQFGKNWDLVCASSIAYQLSRSIMKADQLLSRRQIKPKTKTKPESTLKPQFGGTLFYGTGSVTGNVINLSLGLDMAPSQSKSAAVKLLTIKELIRMTDMIGNMNFTYDQQMLTTLASAPRRQLVMKDRMATMIGMEWTFTDYRVRKNRGK